MRAIIQRVHQAKVMVDRQTTGEIETGLLVLLAIHKKDSADQARQLAQKIIHLRIFEDNEGKMNLNLTDVQGSLLIVSQFTLYGNTQKGHRPSFELAARPDPARILYEYFVSQCRASGVNTATGIFGAHMDVHLVNHGPVTLLCDAES